MKFILSLVLLAALGASPGCRSLGTSEADRAQAEDVGATAGELTSLVPVSAGITLALKPLADLAAREGDRRAAAEDADGADGYSLLTRILIGVGVGLGGWATVRQRRTTAHVDELYDVTKAIEIKAAAAPVAAVPVAAPPKA